MQLPDPVAVISIGLFSLTLRLVLVRPAKAQQLNELLNVFDTSSCLEKPYKCPHPKINFYLYTRKSQQNPELLDVLDEASLNNTHWNPKHPVKILIHGYLGGRNIVPSPNLRKQYFNRGNYNLIVVDYGPVVTRVCHSQLEWGPRFAGMCVSQLLKYLSNHPRGVPPESMHLVGYSLGAHIAGFAANHLSPEEGKLGRITGLDPSIFMYTGLNNSYDLDASDAHFVDIIHTSAGVFGQYSATGHADFYVNGGTKQPTCANSKIFKSFECDHTQATPYFIESINSEEGFWAAPCSSLLSYLMGRCEPKQSEFVQMGEHVTHKARGIYYVTTNAKPPYARGFPGKSSRTSRKAKYRGVRRW